MSYREQSVLREMVNRIEEFDQNYGREATEDAISNGAFHYHEDFGDVKAIFIFRDFDEERIDVPDWITDIFKKYFM